MANILLTTHWSVGEVYPLIKIGRELKARGHNVTVITNCYFESAVQQAGLNFLALDTPTEFEQLMGDAYLFNNPQGFLKIYQKYVLPKVVAEYQLIAKSSFFETILVARSTPGIAARIAAEKLGIPLVAVMSSPSHLSTRSLVEEMIGSMLGDEINQIRKQIGLPSVENWSGWLRNTPSKTIGLWADWFCDATPSELAGVLQTGFIWDDELAASELPTEVKELQQEKAPILITGGTTSLAGEKFFAASAAACKLLGRPGLLVTRHEKLLPDTLPDNVKWVKHLPSLVNCMPYASTIIHHGGLVTSGQALFSGIPQLVLGSGADQLYTGSCLNRLGVGEYLAPPQWQPELIAQSIEKLTNSDSVREHCQILAGKFINSNSVSTSVATTCDVIESQTPSCSPPSLVGKGAGGLGFPPDVREFKKDADTKYQKQLLALAEKLSPEKLALLELRLIKKDANNLKKQIIPAVTRQKELNYFPLSFAQQRLWFLDQLEPGNPTYNISGVVEITGILNIAALEQSFHALAQRHEALRTTFAMVQDQPMQVIHPNLEFVIPVINLESQPDIQQKIQSLINDELTRSFDLTQGSLLRVTLLRINSEQHIMLFSMHHIISDGWSMGILIREIAKFYEAFSTGKSPVLPELPIQYADFAIWQRQWLQAEVLQTQLEYWKRQLAGNTPLRIPTDRPRPQVPTYQGATYSFALPADLSQQLQALSQQAGVTLFMTLLAAFKTLLYRYTQQEDIIVGTDVANRNRAEIEGLIGFFINLLVLRTDLSGNPTFRELLERVRSVALGAYAHQDLPFAKLVEELQPERTSQPTPLFQVLFVMQNIPMSQQSLLGLSMKQMEVDIKTSKFDLALFINETEQGLVGNWNYNTDLFDASTIARMTSHFQVLLSNIVAQPDARIGSLEFITEAERKQQAMQQSERKAFKRDKFVKIAPKAVNISQEKLIKTDYLQPGERLPLVIRPATDGIDIISWTKNNRDFIEKQLLQHGAVLFRGFLKTVLDFENFAQAICPNLFGEYGDLPREGVSGKVYTSTPYPPDKAILFHNESSHLYRFPLKIWFFCVQPATQGGETPIVDCRKVYQLLNPKIQEKFADKKLLYVRNYIDSLDVSWEEFFHTTEKAKVEESCRQAATDFKWLSANGLRTSKICPAVAKHPKTGETVFFNQIQLHHIACLEPAVRESLLSLFSEDKLPRNVYYGDGSPIEDEVIEEILAVYQQATISFPWQQGDVLMLDNMLVAHGRNPYIEPRKIVVAMGEMFNSEDGKFVTDDPKR
jgi:UDP:flavonoid glycosyltransferase YjiC (YdhE family)/alpha-ketoglutarate-dependent taurine dioxygenase